MVRKIIPILVIFLTFPSINQWLEIRVGATTIWWIVNILLLYFCICYKGKYKEGIPDMPTSVKWFMICVLCSGVYGCFKAEGYWDWKILIDHLMCYLLCLSYYYFCMPQNLSDTVRKWCRFGVIAFWFLLPFMQYEAPGKFLIPFSFLVIFWPYFKGKWRSIILFFTFSVFIFGTLGARASILKYGVCFLLSFCFLFPHIFTKKVLRTLSYVFLFSPFIFLILGLFGSFNVFKFDEYLKFGDVEVQNAYGEKGETERLNADTRTFLYVETIYSAIKNNYVIQGHSLARGYESLAFGNDTDFISKTRSERYSSEVSILNVFTYMGVIGVILYFLVFFNAVRNAFKCSHNYMMYVVACYVAFRWSFAWIEDVTHIDINNIFLWMVITMCYSPYYLNMCNKQVCNWFKSYFN